MNKLTHAVLVAGEPAALAKPPAEATLTSSPRNLQEAKLWTGSWTCSRLEETPALWEVADRAAWKQQGEGCGGNLGLYPDEECRSDTERAGLV